MFATRLLPIALLAGLCFLSAPGQTEKQTPGERMAGILSPADSVLTGAQ